MRNSFGCRLVVALAALPACASSQNVALRAPASDAPVTVRTYAYQERLAAKDVGIFAGAVLADGTRIVDPDELLSVVPASSATAQYAASAKHDTRACGIAGAIAGVSTVAGLGGGFADFASQPDGHQVGSLTAGVEWGLAGVAVVASAVALYYCSRGLIATSRAFSSYNESLRHQLHLCVDHLAIVDCDQPVAAPTVQSAPAPPPLAASPQ